MYLTKYEKETIITWNEESDKAEIYTCSAPIMRKCEKLGFKQIDEQRFQKKKKWWGPYIQNLSMYQKRYFNKEI